MFVIGRSCTKADGISLAYWNGVRWTCDRLQAREYSNDCTAKAVMTRKGFKNKRHVYHFVTTKSKFVF